MAAPSLGQGTHYEVSLECLVPKRKEVLNTSGDRSKRLPLENLGQFEHQIQNGSYGPEATEQENHELVSGEN